MDLEAAASFLEEDLLDSADEMRCRVGGGGRDDAKYVAFANERADWLDALAAGVDRLPHALLVEYAKARDVEQSLVGGDYIHCSMTMEIGEGALDPLNIADLVQLYIRAVRCAENDPRGVDRDMADFWAEFIQGGFASEAN